MRLRHRLGLRFWIPALGLISSWLCSGALAQALVNGGRHTGTIAASGGTESWSFSTSAGESVVLRVGATNFPPRIRVFDGANVQIGEVTSMSVGTRDVVIALVTTNAGNYTALVSSANTAGGTYALHFAHAPGDFDVPAGDQGGTLASGANNPGTITLGDLDMWRFTVPVGTGFMVRMGGEFTPRIRVYNPSGALVVEGVSASFGTRDVVVSGFATNTGVYTVVADSTVSGGIGSYTLHLALAPSAVVVTSGDQGGDLVNGAKTAAEIILGDLDVWKFTAAAGDMVHLRMGGAFTPWIRLYGPDGQMVGEAVSASFGTRDVLLESRATNSGDYIVVTSSTVAGGLGAYELTLARLPAEFTTSAGDEGGDLVNGGNTPGNISLGDLDLWRFLASAGDAIILRMGGEFTPKIQLYGPDGELIEEAVSGSFGTRDVTLEARAAASGTYVVVASSTVASGIGAYTLQLAQAPLDYEVSEGDQGGEIISGPANEGEIHLGDMDLWSFEAVGGESFFLRIGAEFAPWLRVYGPDGALAGEANSPSFGTRDVFLNAMATNAGTYLVVVAPAVASGIGEYDLHLVLGRGGLEISEGDEGGALVNGVTNTATLNLGDLDAWTFFGTVGDSNVLRVVATNFAPWVRLYGPAGNLVAESAPPSFGTRTANLVYELTSDPGEYTVVVSAGASGQFGTYAFKQSRWAPDLNVPEDAGVDEGDVVLFTITSQDPDEPVKPLQFELLSGPPQAVFAITGATNATIGWSTSEADGPVTNSIVVKVTDVVNGRSFSRTNSFDVVIREINLAPELTVPSDQVINESTPLNVPATAIDSDLPANPLTFSLVNAPEGMMINASSGAITWTPTEAEGPSTNVITVVVLDESPFAANEKSLGDTNTFLVVVREVNTPPELTVPTVQVIDELASLNVSASAADSDLPTNVIAFLLIDPPQGMSIDPATGAINWMPSESQGGTTNSIAVVARDNNLAALADPVLSTTNMFTVIVTELNSAPVLATQTNRNIPEDTALNVTNAATDADLPVNALTYVLAEGPTNATISAAGAISWTPTEEQGPGTFVFTTVVTDNGTPAQSATNSFSVVLSEVNTTPTIEEIPAQNIRFGELWTNRVVGADDDLPANQLAYSVEEGPNGLTVDAETGALNWTPLQAQVGSHTVRVRVADDGTPGLNAETTFQMNVSGEETRLEISRVSSELMQVTIFGNVGVDYRLERSVDLETWEQQSEFRLTSSPLEYVDPDSTQGIPHRFYRLRSVE